MAVSMQMENGKWKMENGSVNDNVSGRGSGNVNENGNFNGNACQVPTLYKQH